MPKGDRFVLNSGVLIDKLRARTEERNNGYETLCYHWCGPQADGHGYVYIGGRTRKVVRTAYEVLVKSDIDPDHRVFHLCPDPMCWRPSHLTDGPWWRHYQVIRQRSREAEAAGAYPECMSGRHILVPENRAKNGQCAPCEKEAARKLRRARAASQPRQRRSTVIDF